MRILGLLAEYPAPEFERRAAAIRAAASPGVEVEVDVVPGNVFRAGMTDLHRSLIAPIITNSPCAKLMIPITPKISVRPSATRA